MVYTNPFALHNPVLGVRGGHKIVGQKCKELGCTKVLVLTDKGVDATGIPAKLVDLIKAEGIDAYINNNALSDPPEQSVEAIYEETKTKGIDGIVAVGGGSTIDTAKGVRLLLANGGPLAKWFENMTDPQEAGVPLICLSTTSGTGADVSPGGAITGATNGAKRVIIGPAGIPTFTIVDAELTVGAPPKVTASCAFDTLAHAVDGILSNSTSLLNISVCVEAIRLFKESLFEVYYNGENIDAREKMHVAAALGGVSICNAMCSVSHAFGHSLGVKTHASHGLCCGIFLPASIEYAADVAPYEVETIAKALGVEYTANEDISMIAARTARHIFALSQAVRMETIADLLPNIEDTYSIIPMVLADMQCMFSPKPLNEEACKWIIDKTYSYMK